MMGFNLTKICAAIGMMSLAGCVAVDVPPGNSDPEKFSSTVRSSADQVSVVGAPPPGSISVGKVSTFACQRFAWEPSPSKETALILLKAEAAKRGANAVYDVHYRYQNVSPTHNCYGTMFVAAEAIQIVPD